MTEQLKLNEPRITAGVDNWSVSCYAPDSVLNVPVHKQRYEHRQMIENMGGLPCEGRGIPDVFCDRCLFSRT